MILEESALDVVCEKVGFSGGATKDWYINGIFAQANIPNKNKRIYPLNILEREVNLFKENFIATKRSVGELSHPESMEINPDRAAILIESLEKDGNNFLGKAKVLPTPCGKIVQGLLEGGVKVGVSTRGCGSLKKKDDGISEVAEDYRLFTVDVVLNPSAPNAIVDSIFESEKQYQTLVESFLSDDKIEQIMEWRKKILNENKKLRDFKNKVIILTQLESKLHGL
jgi:hypothetical protein